MTQRRLANAAYYIMEAPVAGYVDAYGIVIGITRGEHQRDVLKKKGCE
jgi:hypothetical protein